MTLKEYVVSVICNWYCVFEGLCFAVCCQLGNGENCILLVGAKVGDSQRVLVQVKGSKGTHQKMTFGMKAHDVIDIHNSNASNDVNVQPRFDAFIDRKKLEANCNGDQSVEIQPKYTPSMDMNIQNIISDM